jgi:hypothetical protein
MPFIDSQHGFGKRDDSFLFKDSIGDSLKLRFET